MQSLPQLKITSPFFQVNLPAIEAARIVATVFLKTPVAIDAYIHVITIFIIKFNKYLWKIKISIGTTWFGD